MQIADELANISHAARSRMMSQASPQGNLIAGDPPNNFTVRPVTVYAESRQAGIEPAFFKLTRYTTIFLVDDSSSMEDLPEFDLYPWTETTQALAECAKIVLGANGRLKIHFFNSERSRENITGVPELEALCSSVIPRGDTPTYERLKRHLDEFVEAFKPLTVAEREAYPGLNLLIFTDGAPEGRFDDIEEVIVDTAQDLDEFKPRVDKYKVGIQFIQIGDDMGVKAFFDRIDDKIKGEHKLRRDVSSFHSAHISASYLLITDSSRSSTPRDTIRPRLQRKPTRRLCLAQLTRRGTTRPVLTQCPPLLQIKFLDINNRSVGRSVPVLPHLSSLFQPNEWGCQDNGSILID